MASVTVNGTTYDSATSFSGYSYVEGIINFAADLLVDATQNLVTTSTTSYTLGAGSGTITLAAELPIKAGAFFILADAAAPTTNYALIQASSDASGTSLSFTEIAYAGSGTKTSWTLNPSGMRGAAGTLSGNASGAIDMNGNTLTVDAVTVQGTISAGDQLIQRPKLQDISETRVQANTGTSYTIDLENGNVFELTLTGNCTYTFSNPPASGSSGTFVLIQKQDGTGSRTVTWPASVDWPGASAPTLSSGANDVDIFVFTTVDGGTTWYGVTSGQDFG